MRYWPIVTLLDCRDTRKQQGPEHGHHEAEQRQRGEGLDQREAGPARDRARAQWTTRTSPALDIVIWRLEGPAAIVTVRGSVATPEGETVTLALGQDQ